MEESFIQDSIAASSSRAVTAPSDATVEISSTTEVRRRATSSISPTSPRAAHETHMSPRMSSRKGKEKASLDDEVLDEVAERSDDGEVSEQGTDGDEILLVDYEADRQRRIRENQALLTSLGIHSSQTVILNPDRDPSPNHAHAPLRRRKKVTGPRFDRSGYVLSLPGPGEKQVMACVEIPADRKVRKRIAEGAYVDRTWWSVGEERRWRFGYGEGVLEPGERPVVGGVAPNFRWREWRGVQEELRAERKQIDDLIDKDMRAEQIQDQGVSAYSLIPGQACHQCRRKSEKPKMQCRNVNPACRAAFCESCCKRYSYFDFDPDARSFICPLCKGCCNCANCLRKRNLSHLLDAKGGGIDKKQLEAAGGLTVQAWIEKAAEQRETLPFDRVRLVDKDTDVISPDLPEPVDVVMTPVKGGGKKRRKEDTVTGTGTGTGNGIGSASKAKKAKKPIVEEGLEENPIIVKLRIPSAAKPQPKKSPVKPKAKAAKVKQDDSDGDTVGAYSSDEMSSRLSSAPPSQSPEPEPESEPVVKRFAFPPRPSQSTNEFLSSIVDASHTPPFDPPFNLDHALPVPQTSRAPLMDDMFQSQTVYDAFAATVGQTNGVMPPMPPMPPIAPNSAPIMAMQRSASAASAVPSPTLHSLAPPNMETSMILAPTDELSHVASVSGLAPNLVSLPRFDSPAHASVSLWGVNNGLDMHTGMEAFSDTLFPPSWHGPPLATPAQISDTPISPDYARYLDNQPPPYSHSPQFRALPITPLILAPPPLARPQAHSAQQYPIAQSTMTTFASRKSGYVAAKPRSLVPRGI